MNSNYWQANEKVRISTDEITIPSANGLNFGSNANTNIRLKVPKTVKFFIGDQSFLRFQLSLEYKGTSNFTGTPESSSFMQLIPQLGASAIIRNLTVRSHDGKIIEHIQNYNSLLLAMNQYDTTADKENIRSYTEGGVNYDPRCRAEHIIDEPYIQKTRESNCSTNPYFETTSTGVTSQKKVDVCLALKGSGVFGSNRACPNGVLGCSIEIELENASTIMRGTSRAMAGSRNNPVVSFGRAATGSVVGAVGSGLENITAGGYDRVYCQRDNSMVNLETQPFKVGEVINITLDDATSETVGQIKSIGLGAGVGAGAGNFIYYELESAYTPTSDAKTPNTNNLFSNNFETGGLTNTTLKYEVANLELVLKRADVEDNYIKQMDQAMTQNGKINFEFASYQNYQRQTLADELNSTILLPIQNSKARSILCIPTEVQLGEVANLTNIQDFKTNYFNLAGQNLINNYQFVYEGRNHPNRVVSCLRNATTNNFNQNHILELQKALIQGNIPPNSLRALKHNFIIGRSFSVGNGFYDARGKDTMLNIDYSGIANQKNKLFNNFVCHIRTVEITSNGINLII